MANVLSALGGEIDHAAADGFRSDLYDLIDRCEMPIVHVDLAAVTFINSAGYQALVDGTEYATHHGPRTRPRKPVDAMREGATALRPGQRPSHRRLRTFHLELSHLRPTIDRAIGLTSVALPDRSDVDAVVEVNDAVLEPAFIEEFELRADVVRHARLPPPTTIGNKNR